ncbi:hypothetical protein SNE40_016814 [Patella caerulea]|uniref:Alpha-galactosidase n=1 Tax=Patella caerulea TaxID=87958 RepID=A0AAN8JDZ1_PATCE
MMKLFEAISIICLLVVVTEAANNGVARTPPLGWMSWERFRCNTDCVTYPDSCISEKLIMQMADHMAADGYKDVGYEYICIDDCWPLKTRGADGRLVPDPARFPSGMKALADYVHSKGLKIGIYTDFGHSTCGGYPGSEFYLETDANTFAEWEMDMLKLDVCFSSSADFKYGFPAMEFYLNRTGRQFVFSCEWDWGMGDGANYTHMAEFCNLWRVAHDMEDYWDNVQLVIDVYANNSRNFSDFTGPGAWADADSVIVGLYGLSADQERAHFGMWSMFASPLLLGADLRSIKNESKALLQNKNILAINQDPLGRQATLKMKLAQNKIYVFLKGLTGGRTAIALFNSDYHGQPVRATFMLNQLGLTNGNGYSFTDGFTGMARGKYMPATEINIDVNPTGIDIFIATPV